MRENYSRRKDHWENIDEKKTINQKRNRGIKIVPEKARDEIKEDEELVTKNDRINKTYKNPNQADKYLIDEDTGEDELINQIDENIKKEKELNEKDVRDTLEKGKKYNGKIIDFDRYGNAIIMFDNLEEEGMLYKGQKIGLNSGDEKEFIYIGQNKNKTKYIFTLNHHKNHKNHPQSTNSIKLELKDVLQTPRKKIKRKKRNDLTK